MTTAAPPVSRVARDTLALIADLPDMDDAELIATADRAARDYTDNALHRKLPVERQGSTDARAWAFRQEWQDAAEALWLAVQAERDARRCPWCSPEWPCTDHRQEWKP